MLPNEPPVAGHRPQGDVGRVPHPGHVGIEGAPVTWIPGRERRHPDGLGVTHLVEQRVQVVVLDRPQRDARRHARPPSPRPPCSKANITAAADSKAGPPGRFGRMKKLLELLVCILHPIAVILMWIDLATRRELGGVAKLAWAIFGLIPLVPFLYVLTGGDLW